MSFDCAFLRLGASLTLAFFSALLRSGADSLFGRRPFSSFLSNGAVTSMSSFCSALIRRSASALKLSCPIFAAFRLVSDLRSSGSSLSAGMDAESTKTGITIFPRSNAVDISSRTKSYGSSNRSAPFSSAAVSQLLPMTARTMSADMIERTITETKSAPSAMRSISKKILSSAKCATKRSYRRPADPEASSRRYEINMLPDMQRRMHHIGGAVTTGAFDALQAIRFKKPGHRFRLWAHDSNIPHSCLAHIHVVKWNRQCHLAN